MNALLTNKNAVIYGAGGGLGAGIAETFAREGARLHLCGRTREPLDRVAAAVRAAGGEAEVAVLDARDPQAVEAHLEQAGRVDISFNLISRGDVQGKPLTAMTPGEFMAPIEAGPHANFVTATAAARRMTAQDAGVILWLTSGSSTGAAPGMGGTGPADAATDNLMRQLAREVGRAGVRVCGIWTAGVPETFARGEHDTNAARRRTGLTPEQIDELIGGLSALGRAPRLQQVADTAAFLASDSAAGITATVVNVTCGLVSER
jgi:NAD(P)-dependent dehydrogenase (short-subunit alcohol dehydrogenase family)